jgi:hypothetical protein
VYHNLPVLSRKWDKIDLNRKYRNENQKWKSIVEQTNNGVNRYTIAQNLNTNARYVEKIQRLYREHNERSPNISFTYRNL